MSTSEQPCRQFSLDEIKSATRDFDDELIIGKGGFGSVYIGSFNDGAEIVAIKRLSIESTQGDTEFLREIETLSKLQHDNLVRLEGYCNESTEKILVYEYMPNGTLVDHLYKIKGSTSVTGDNQPSRLTWEQRLSICIGAAKGLDFLHRGALPGVIHRDIKGSNILLDGNFGAKIADFGLAKLVKPTNDPNITCVSTTIFKGTFGYMDPEYFYTQRLTTKTDVYAFGVVLLVVLSGRPAVDNKAPDDQRSLSEWAKKCIEKNRTDLIIDTYLVGKISPRSLKQFVKVSQRCLRRQSEQRPTMEEVVGCLELALQKQPISGLTTRQLNEWSNFRQMIMAKLQLVPKKKQHAHADKEKCVPSTSVLQIGNFQSLSRVEPRDLVAGYLCPQFSLDEIKSATKNFSNNIGEGGFGSVYLGQFSDGEDIVAIKRFRSKSAFLGEIEILCKLQHDHIVRLKGYCTESSEMILVYEYLAEGSLENHLYKLGDNRDAPLTWEQRLNICIGAARGLDFLHRLNEPGIIHRDVKCSNIMLDDNFVPKITDFGLAKHANYGDDAISTHLFGTLGYIAPEYYDTGKVTKKIDVYGFGVVLIAVLSGRRPYHIREFSGDVGNDEMPLCAWAVECIQDNRIGELIDPNIRWQIDSKCLEKFLKVAQNCLHVKPKDRLTMEDVVASLELALKKQLSSTSTSTSTHLLGILPKKDIIEDVKCALSASVVGYLCPHFSLDEIKIATQNFSNNIGEDGYGSVYLGRIRNGEVIVAIKRFSSKSAFLGEIVILCKLQHYHVIRLKGYCVESSEMILIYEYLAKGSLENHLYKLKYNGHAPLTWEQRLNICIGAARGLDSLHRVTDPGFIHRDVKCSNIMLDDNFVPKITDFGLAKLAKYEDDDISTNVRGTFGYIAPEYFTTGKVTKKIDVYGFGVVLLVVLSGRRPYPIREFSGDDAVHLYAWAVECIQDNRIDALIDPDLRGQFKSESLEKFMEVVQNCLHMVPEKRHTMEDVVAGLESALQKQLSSTSTQWVESHELPNLLFLLPKNEGLREDEYVDEGESEIGEYSSELYNEFMEEYSDM